MHRWLRPGGALINLQPYAQPIAVEVRAPGGTRVVGRAFDVEQKIVDMRSSLSAVEDLVAEGLFALRAQAVWTFEMGHPTHEEWDAFIDKESCGGVEADVSAIREALERPDAGVFTAEPNLALVYERIGTFP